MRNQILSTFGAALCMLVLTVAGSSVAYAQSILAYPAKGQSPEQVRKDETECQLWAMERTGFSPNQPPPRATSTNYSDARYSSSSSPAMFGSGETGQGGVLSDGARGAAIGAIGGAIAGDAGKGAAWGALGGAVLGGARRNQRKQQEADRQRQQQAQQQRDLQQKQQAYNGRLQNFNNAVALCMESRDYNVK